MTRSSSVKAHCVICFREIVGKGVQPLNPRKVFKVCSHYLRPEVFPKYTKWDFLNDLERESPFCAMCVTSGEKLSALNDRVEELQREIISFIKYFAKEVIRNRANDDNDSEIRANEAKTNIQVSSQMENDSNKIEKRKTRSSDNNRSTTASIFKNKDSLSAEDIVIVKHEVEDQPYFPSEDEDYELPSGTDAEDDSDGEDVYEPRQKKGKSDRPIKLNKSGEASKRNLNRVPHQWTEINITDEEIEKDWKIDRTYVTQHAGDSTYFHCKIDGKSCPVRLVKRTLDGVRFYRNEKAHKHRKKIGIRPHVKMEIFKILEVNPRAKPSFILETLRIKKGIIIGDTRKLKNLLSHARRTRFRKSDNQASNLDASTESNINSGTSDEIAKKDQIVGSA